LEILTEQPVVMQNTMGGVEERERRREWRGVRERRKRGRRDPMSEVEERGRERRLRGGRVTRTILPSDRSDPQCRG
jgi:hypothetical protein